MNKSEKINQKALARMEKGGSVPLLKIIRLKCLDCCCWQEQEVNLCPAKDCILWNFRMGKNPFSKKRVLSKKQLEALRKANAKRKKK